MHFLVFIIRVNLLLVNVQLNHRLIIVSSFKWLKIHIGVLNYYSSSTIKIRWSSYWRFFSSYSTDCYTYCSKSSCWWIQFILETVSFYLIFFIQIINVITVDRVIRIFPNYVQHFPCLILMLNNNKSTLKQHFQVMYHYKNHFK